MARRKPLKTIKPPDRAVQNKVEFHPMRDQIIERIMAGETVRGIARDCVPKLSHMCISRYRADVLRPELARALLVSNKVAAAACATRPPNVAPGRTSVMQTKLSVEQVNEAKEIMRTPVLSIFRQRLEALHTRVERVLDRAEAGDDLYPIPQIMNQAHKNLEMLGRATGELDNKAQAANLAIQIICPSAPTQDSVRISFASSDAIEQPLTDATEDIALEQ